MMNNYIGINSMVTEFIYIYLLGSMKLHFINSETVHKNVPSQFI